MTSFNPTTMTQSAMQAALQDASAKGNPDIRPAHLLVALLEQEDSIALPVLQAAGVEPQAIAVKAKNLVAGYPQATGSDMANPQFNRDALNALTAAQELAEQLGIMQAPTLVVIKDGQVKKIANASNIRKYAETIA